MPCFHFSVAGETPTTDDGVILPDMAAARIEAVRLAGAMLRDAPANFWEGQAWSLVVTNCDRKRLFSLGLVSQTGDENAAPRETCPAPLDV